MEQSSIILLRLVLSLLLFLVKVSCQGLEFIAIFLAFLRVLIELIFLVLIFVLFHFQKLPKYLILIVIEGGLTLEVLLGRGCL